MVFTVQVGRGRATGKVPRVHSVGRFIALLYNTASESEIHKIWVNSDNIRFSTFFFLFTRVCTSSAAHDDASDARTSRAPSDVSPWSP